MPRAIITPEQVERRLLELSKEIDEAQQFLEESEAEYFHAKGACEIGLAQARLRIDKDGLKMTVRDKEDVATVECSHLLRALYVAEAKVRAARGNAQRVKTQIDIARSVGTSVRAALEN